MKEIRGLTLSNSRIFLIEQPDGPDHHQWGHGNFVENKSQVDVLLLVRLSGTLLVRLVPLLWTIKGPSYLVILNIILVSSRVKSLINELLVMGLKGPTGSPDHHRGLHKHRIRGCGPLYCQYIHS